jgi:hypothetical protein
MWVAGLSMQRVAREGFGPFVDTPWSFTPPGIRKATRYWFFGRMSFLRSHDVLATPFRSGLRSPFSAWPSCWSFRLWSASISSPTALSTLPSADYCATVRMNGFILSHNSVTWRRSPEVSSTAFDAQATDLPPVSLMDMDFAITSPLARHRTPPIRFLFIGSHLCSALLSGPASRRL